MATKASLGAKAQELMDRTNAIIEEHAPGHMGRMRPLTVTGAPPVRTNNPEELTRVMVYQAEQTLALAELVHGLKTAERNSQRAAERERKARARKDEAA